MNVDVMIIPCTREMLNESDLLKFTIPPHNLSCRMVHAELDMQIKAMETLMQNSAMSVAVIYGKENIDDLVKLRGHPFDQPSTLHRLPIRTILRRLITLEPSFLLRRNFFYLRTHNDIENLLSSQAWQCQEGTFTLFTNDDDSQLITRFANRKLAGADTFTAIIPYNDLHEHWIVISNQYSENNLQVLLQKLFA